MGGLVISVEVCTPLYIFYRESPTKRKYLWINDFAADGAGRAERGWLERVGDEDESVARKRCCGTVAYP